MNPYNIASPIHTDHLARPFFSGPNVKEKKGSLGGETTKVSAWGLTMASYEQRLGELERGDTEIV